MSDLPQQMRNAAKTHQFKGITLLEAGADEIDRLRAAIAAGVPEVKPLAWANEGFEPGGKEWSSEATTSIGVYWVIHESSGCYVFYNRRRILGNLQCWDRDDAKAAAQADYERRIRSALSNGTEGGD